jgi:hypothetical protein
MYTHITAVSTATVTTSNGTVSGSTGATTAFKIKGYTATRTLSWPKTRLRREGATGVA